MGVRADVRFTPAMEPAAQPATALLKASSWPRNALVVALVPAKIAPTAAAAGRRRRARAAAGGERGADTGPSVTPQEAGRGKTAARPATHRGRRRCGQCCRPC